MKVDQAYAYTHKWSGQDPAYLTLKDGSRLRYLKIGDGPPLLLIHTVRTQLDLFQKLIPKLAARYTVYAVDLPGFGWSDILPGVQYTEPFLRARLREFIQTLNLKRLVIAGESIGAVLALTLASEALVDVQQVVAFNTYDYFPGLERSNLLASFIIKNVRAPLVGPIFASLENRTILAGIMRGGVYDPKALPADFLDELSRVGARKGYSVVARSVYKSLASFVAARLLYAAVNVPVALVYGDHDWSKPAERQANATLIPGCTFTTLPRSGHFSTLESPDLCAAILLQLPAAAAPAHREQPSGVA
jgi:pimeloyl-ACP methyl ester carboxylesterase